MIFKKVSTYIRQEKMISAGEKIVTALSGGIDSMVMLDLLLRYQKENGGSLVIAHLNHGLRGKESDRDEDFVKSTASHLNVECYSKKIDLKNPAGNQSNNLQEAARNERYAFFESVADRVKGDKVALGHNADDQAETTLMRIIRGSGINGLGGIPPARGKIIRPILGLSREEIEDYASRKSIPYVQDSSNLNKKYLRNRIRHELIPALRNYNPNISRELSMLTHICRDVESYLNTMAVEAFEKTILHEMDWDGGIFLDLLIFNLQPAALRGKIINMAFNKLTTDSTGLYSTHIVEVEALAKKGESGSSVNLPKGVNAFIEYGKLGFSLWKKGEVEPFSYPLNLEGETFVAELDLTFTSKKVMEVVETERKNKNTIYLDMNKINAPLIFRNFQNGDRIRIKGMSGRKKLKDLYIDEKVPVRLRRKVPLLTAGDEILWAVGLRHGGNAIADCGSKDILKVSKN